MFVSGLASSRVEMVICKVMEGIGNDCVCERAAKIAVE